MLRFLLLLTLVMLKHTLLELFPFKIPFFKGNKRALGYVGVNRDRKIAHLGLILLVTHDQLEQNTLRWARRKKKSSRTAAHTQFNSKQNALTSPCRAAPPPPSIRLPVNSDPDSDDADAMPRLLRLLSYLRLSKLSAILPK